MNILIRADSSSTIGLGHIMRDLVLCKQLQEQFSSSNIFFATQNLDGNINHKIIEAGYKVIDIDPKNKKELLNIIDILHIDLLVIDHYNIDEKYEKAIKKKTGIKIMVLDDTYQKHHCDILLNHNISADKKRYKGLVPKNCELRCGSKYTLLRDEFYKQKSKKQKQKDSKTKTIFLAMGGVDHTGINQKIIKVLAGFKNIKVHLVTSSSNKKIKELKKTTDEFNWIDLHIDSKKIAKLMKNCDFAILTPSVTVNEAHFMNLKFIAIKTAENQDDLYNYLKKNSLPILKKFNRKKLKSKISTMLKAIKDD